LQIAHYAIANELRRRGRRPDAKPGSEEQLAVLRDDSPDPGERAWMEERRAALRMALDRLPPPQRQALRVGVLVDLSRAEVARRLSLPLGTSKSRIRMGLAALRVALAPILAGLLAVVIAVGLIVRLARDRAALTLRERALAMVTSSDTLTIRLSAAPGVSQATHGNYRTRPGAAIAVITFSTFAAAPAGSEYRAWARYGSAWTLLGSAAPDVSGHALLIAESPALGAGRPDEVRVTLEPGRLGKEPGGRILVSSSP